MHTHQDRLIGTPFALDEGDVFQAIVDLPEGNELEVAILRGQVHLVAHLDDFLGAQAVGNQVLDGDDGHIEFFGHLHQLRQAGHRAVRVDDLDECGGRVEACDAHQVDGCLGVARTLEHTLIDGAQRVDVSGAAKV